MSRTIHSFLLLLAISSLSSTTNQWRSPSSPFQQEQARPTSKHDFFETSFTLGRQPVQVSAGFRLKPPPFKLPRFITTMPNFGRQPVQVSAGFQLKPPPFKLPRFITTMRNFELLPRPESSGPGQSRIPLLFPLPLFTPNTAKQPAATRGQVDEFNKALEEEELEKEKSSGAGRGPSKHNDELDEFENFPGRSQNYVNVRSNQYNYNYTL